MLTPDNSTIKSTRRDQDYSSSIKDSAPSRASGDKDFKKILGQKERDQNRSKNSVKSDEIDEDESGDIALQESVLVSKAPPSSIFDFSKNPDEETPTKTLIPTEEVSESPSKLFSRLSSPKPDFQEELSKKGRIPSQFVQEQSDLSYVDLNTSPIPANVQPQYQPTEASFAPVLETAANSVKTPVTQQQRIQSIQALVNQIVESIDQIRRPSEGITETAITLKNMPLFEGSKLYVTSFDQATKEFNIRFENLTPAAKDLLDMKQYQESLRLSLQERGYTIHIVTTTTYIETAPIAVAEQDRLKRDPQGFGENPQKKKKQQDEETQ